MNNRVDSNSQINKIIDHVKTNIWFIIELIVFPIILWCLLRYCMTQEDLMEYSTNGIGKEAVLPVYIIIPIIALILAKMVQDLLNHVVKGNHIMDSVYGKCLHGMVVFGSMYLVFYSALRAVDYFADIYGSDRTIVYISVFWAVQHIFITNIPLICDKI